MPTQLIRRHQRGLNVLVANCLSAMLMLSCTCGSYASRWAIVSGPAFGVAAALAVSATPVSARGRASAGTNGGND